MSRPAKKGTPDPIVQETVLAPVPSFDELMSGFTRYSARSSSRAARVPYLKLNPRSAQFSSAAVSQFGLKAFQTVDVFYNRKVLRFVFRKDGDGEFKLTMRLVDRTELKLSATGFVKAWKLPESSFEKRMEIVEKGHGILDVDLYQKGLPK